MLADTELGMKERPDSPTAMETVLAGAVDVGFADVDVGGVVDDAAGGLDIVECVDVVNVVVVFAFGFVDVVRVAGLVDVNVLRVGIGAGALDETSSFVFDGDVDVVEAEKAMPTSDAKMARRNDILAAVVVVVVI